MSCQCLMGSLLNTLLRAGGRLQMAGARLCSLCDPEDFCLNVFMAVLSLFRETGLPRRHS